MATNDPPLKRLGWLREIDPTRYWVVLMGALVIGSGLIGSSPVAQNIILMLMGVGVFLLYVRVRNLSRNLAEARRASASQSAGEDDPAGSQAPPLFQFRIWDLAVLVAIYALIFGVQRYIDDQFGQENAPARGLRALRSSDPTIRAWGALQLDLVFITGRPAMPPKQLEALAGALLAALDDNDANVREAAASAVLHVVMHYQERSQGHFKNGLEPILPTLLRMLERDASPDVRGACKLALMSVKFTSAAVPALVAGLHSPDRRARFIAADRLSYIVPRAVDAVPDLLPLLEESFEPQTPFERNQPAYSDPAVAACWALGAIAPGSAMAGRAEAALVKVLLDPKHPWRSSQAQEALARIRAAGAAGGRDQTRQEESHTLKPMHRVTSMCMFTRSVALVVNTRIFALV